jgi:hypothetical protein
MTKWPQLVGAIRRCATKWAAHDTTTARFHRPTGVGLTRLCEVQCSHRPHPPGLSSDDFAVET